MKISLSQQEVDGLAASGGDFEALSQAVAACKLGDWEAKHTLDRMFHPLLAMLAAKRVGSDTAASNRLIERGREGLYRAAKQFPKRRHVRHFRLFALPFIEAAMDRPPSFWQRFFAKR